MTEIVIKGLGVEKNAHRRRLSFVKFLAIALVLQLRVAKRVLVMDLMFAPKEIILVKHATELPIIHILDRLLKYYL